MTVELRQLTMLDEKAFFEGMKEWKVDELSWYTFAWRDGMSFSQMLEILKKEKAGIDIAPDRVPHTMLYGFMDGKIIGRVSVRHELNERLRHRGGHIGYSVAEKFRNKGYATDMARQALDYCKSLGLQSIMVTCSDSNTPSWKVIERFGGKLEDRVWNDEDNEMIRRYWITL
ncbi:GNAT family N-acetyltransferase [Bdellovibrio sp. GT3]|uniref:GNAT family N-acetyltransferase n=1 Tax=Bdellovibrio sp. GT3 TaxID=3136282 RepID=UPI0030F16F26